MSGIEEVVVRGSASRCHLCRQKWKEAFPDLPVGCYFGGQETDPPVFFDEETGWPVQCKTGDPMPDSLTAFAVLDVLDHTRDQLTGEGAGVSVEAMQAVADIRKVEVDGFFIDLWSVASAEWMTMRAERVKEQMDAGRSE